MNEAYIQKLIRLVEDSNIASLEVSRWGQKIKIQAKGEAHSNGHGSVVGAAPAVAAPVASAAPAPSSPAPVEAAAPSADTSSNLVEIKSPMVGTFYAAPAPDADPYVSMNERITVGQVVCIVEAMKLMNEIESEVSGRVAEILAENGKPVEFGQVLYRIDPNG
ncbi:MAG: acetyl-CoA carboxylase biotin carboxyl carrier protein [candidate division Zixibacteria bacterium]|nr:acetyl-CoA carboxylase biotin carboxyl carrier protein [candidate division Zixibacteria bacterium]